jgi:hypothetical protein
MVAINLSSMPSKVIGWKACLMLEILLGCQKILDPRDTQTLEGGKSKKKWKTL